MDNDTAQPPRTPRQLYRPRAAKASLPARPPVQMAQQNQFGALDAASFPQSFVRLVGHRDDGRIYVSPRRADSEQKPPTAPLG